MATETHSDGLADAIGVDMAEHASTPGMPQLDFSTWGNQVFWLVLALIATYLILSRVALPRIGAILSERQGTISNDIAAAEDLKAKAVDAEEVYNKALADARTEAHRIVAEAKADIQVDLNAALAKADTKIAKKTAESEKAIGEIRASALENVAAVAKDTTKEIVAAMGGKADAKTVLSLIHI